MNRRRNDVSKTIKDYWVPIVGLFLIIILAWGIFGGSSDWVVPEVNNGSGWEVTLQSPTSDAVIIYEGDYEADIEQSAKLFQWEKVFVKTGSAKIQLDGIGTFHLDKLWELKYNIGDNFTLLSSNLWFESQAATQIQLQFGNSVQVAENSVVSISQNDVQATVYVLSGTATLYSQMWEEVTLAKAEQVTLSRKDSLDENLDLSLAKQSFDEFFKVSDWYIKNNGDFFLNTIQADPLVSGTGAVVSTLSTPLQLTSVFDESSVSSSPIKLEWSYDATLIGRVTIDNIEADIDDSTGIFTIDKFTLSGQVNDLVVKAYSRDNALITKDVYTIYYSWASSLPTAWVTSSTWANTIYDVDATQFGFTAPSSSGKFATTGSEITIRGITTAQWISKVIVDGFELKSFNGSTWRYHAFTRFDTLAEGTNRYEVQYIGENGNVVYTDYYTIVKKPAGTVLISEEKETAIISDEA